MAAQLFEQLTVLVYQIWLHVTRCLYCVSVLDLFAYVSVVLYCVCMHVVLL